MQRSVLLGLFGVMALAGVGGAAPRRKAKPPAKPPAPVTFTAPVAYDACSTSWMFACGMRDGGGHTYGTAKETTRCERYAFLPDGTYTIAQRPGLTGTYAITGSTLTLTETDEGGAVTSSTLVLAADGSTLGTMKRVK